MRITKKFKQRKNPNQPPPKEIIKALLQDQNLPIPNHNVVSNHIPQTSQAMHSYHNETLYPSQIPFTHVSKPQMPSSTQISLTSTLNIPSFSQTYSSLPNYTPCTPVMLVSHNQQGL